MRTAIATEVVLLAVMTVTTTTMMTLCQSRGHDWCCGNPSRVGAPCTPECAGSTAATF
jgi:hypothetical protein